ncbi:MAG: amidohydrolase family protein [Armatimonadota bacterium]
MEWFDCHAEIGRRMIPSPLQAVYAADLAELYGAIGIQRALVVHAGMYELHAPTGNALVIEETRDYPQFSPAWAILPPQTGEMGDVPVFLDAMRRANVRALWFYPTGQILNTITFGPLFEEMVARKIPLFLRVGDLGSYPASWSALTDLLAEVPGLRVVITLPTVWGQDRLFRPLVERFPNLHLATSLLALEGGLRDFSRRYGPHRLLFSSGFPDNQPGGSLFTLLHAGLPDEETAAIAGSNLRRLLAEVQL